MPRSTSNNKLKSPADVIDVIRNPQLLNQIIEKKELISANKISFAKWSQLRNSTNTTKSINESGTGRSSKNRYSPQRNQYVNNESDYQPSISKGYSTAVVSRIQRSEAIAGSPLPPKRKVKITFENSPVGALYDTSFDHPQYYLNSESKRKKLLTIDQNQTLHINTVHCKGEYSLLKEVIKMNNWKEMSQLGKGHILWYGNALSETDKTIVNNRGCWYNRYVGCGFLTYKRTFNQLLANAQRVLPTEFDRFIPNTYYLPEDTEKLEQAILNNEKNSRGVRPTYIAKPNKGYGGIGIQMIQRVSDIPEEERDMVVQEYVANPLLIEKQVTELVPSEKLTQTRKKFDMRLYLLFKGVDPLQVYMCQEGMARFCTEDYEEPSADNLAKAYVHLTNFTLNKDSDNYINQKDFMTDDIGTKRLVTTVMRTLKEQKGIDVNALWKKIEDVSIKSVSTIIPFLKNQFSIAFGKNNPNQNCFQVYGIDILIDSDCNPWVLEINSNPSFSIIISKFERKEGTNDYKIRNEVSEIDKFIKSKVLTDAFKILTCGEDSVETLGSFKKIFPSKETSYQTLQIFDDARLVFEALAGQREFHSLTASQFLKIAHCEPSLFQHKYFNKYDYELLFQQATKSSKSKQLPLIKFVHLMHQVMDKIYSVQKDKAWKYKDYHSILAVLKEAFVAESSQQY